METVVIKKANGFSVTAVPVLSDNLVYLISRDRQAVLIDAGQAAPVLACLERLGLTLRHIFVTHGDSDHVAGLSSLSGMIKDDGADAAGPIKILQTPGHTRNDISLYHSGAGVVFTGDVLINGACGRVFSGDYDLMYESLQKILSLPDETIVCGGHDYLEDNLLFSLSVEPGNQAVKKRLAAYRRLPAAGLFVSLSEEKETNPFLRVANATEFKELRMLKNRS